MSASRRLIERPPPEAMGFTSQVPSRGRPVQSGRTSARLNPAVPRASATRKGLRTRRISAGLPSRRWVSESPLDPVGMILDRAGVEPGAPRAAPEQPVAGPRALLDRHVIDGAEGPKIAIGEMVNATRFQPSPQSPRRQRPGCWLPRSGPWLVMVHERSLVPCELTGRGQAFPSDDDRSRTGATRGAVIAAPGRFSQSS